MASETDLAEATHLAVEHALDKCQDDVDCVLAMAEVLLRASNALRSYLTTTLPETKHG